MPRIPDDLLDRIKQDVSLVTLVERRGVALKKHGDNLLGLCPLHEDHEPSLVITPAKNLWHCLGACQTGGSTIDWVMKSEGLSFRHAVEILRSEFFPEASFPVRPAGPPPKRSTVPRLASPLDLDADDRAVMLQVVGYYNDVLKQSPEALAYLENRGLRSSEVIDRFMLGYANRTLGYRLPGMGWKSGQEIRLRLQKLGLFRGTGHEHFSGSLVVPIFNEEGDVLSVYGRKVRDDLRPGTAYHLYLPGPHRGVFNVQALAAAKEVILCEALIDALTFWCAGYRNVTAAYGVEGFTQDHLDAFKRYGTEHVLIAYDRDEAGDRAAGKLAERLRADGSACSRILFPKGMDANEYALKVQPAEKSLGVLIRSAEWLGNGRKPAVLASRATLPSSRSEASQESPKSAAKEDGAETVDAGDAVKPLESPAPTAAVLPVDAGELGGAERAAKEEKGGNSAGPSLVAVDQLEPLDQLTAPAVHDRLVREAAADVAVRTDELDE
ncbi:MAG: toprim domain-containing protein, partial [Deltaproteobacteria bacterium]|nr:toprim domain-containing protein [Deltaproteobacteria bacterium]